jgi:DNA-binding SARP family transcriptional activator/tetratricopeptide (TPR) repeat protein
VVHLRALGECALETEVARIGPDSRYVFALGLYLVLERGRRIPRQGLVDLLWPDVRNESQAKHRFRQTLLRLKQLGVPVQTEAAHVRLDRDAASADFEPLLVLNGSAEEVVANRESFQFLYGYQPKVSEQYAAWLDLHRARVELGIQRVFVHALKSARTRGDWSALENLAIASLRIDPLNEEANMARAEATAMRGSKSQALRILDTYMDALGERSLAIGLPAKLLRSRIAERMTQPQYTTLSEAHFVGREEEVALLSGMLDEAKHGRGGAILIVGAAGIGKTRLLSEVTQISSLKGMTLATVNCQPTGIDRPIGLLADLVTVLRALPGSIGASVESLSLLQRLTEYTEPAPAPPDFGEAGVAGAAIRRAVFDLFEAVAEENTLLITMEDVHWADTSSWKLVRTLAESAPRRRVLILATSRPPLREEVELNGDRSTEPFQTRELPPLNAGASQVLLERLLADYGSSVPQEMLQWCVSVAEGNPYYLRELLTRWLETQEPFGVPHSLAELVDRKLTRLSSEALRVFQACVAFGSSCTVERLERIEATEPAQLIRALDELSLGGMIVSDGADVLPKHDLLAQAATRRLAPVLKALIHRRIATVLEAESREDADPTALWECAHHWQMAGESGRAVAFLINCGRHLVSVGLSEEAADLYRRGMDVPDLTAHQQLTLHEGLIAALRQSGLLEQVLTEVTALRTFACDSNLELMRHSDIELMEVEAQWRTGKDTRAITEQLERCMTALDAPAAHRLRAAFWLLAIAQSTGRGDDAERVWRRAEPLIEDPACDELSRCQLAMVYHTDYGDLETGARYARQLVRAARLQPDAVGQHRALRNASLSLRRAGYWDEAKMLLQETFESATQSHAALSAVDAAHLLAGLALEEGHLDRAREWLRRADGGLPRWESALLQSDLMIVRSRLAILEKNWSTARELASSLPNWQSDRNLRRSQVVLSILLLLHLNAGELHACEELLGPAEARFEALCDRGHQDFPIEALSRVYLLLRSREAAKQFLRNYGTTHRRDRGPIPPSLAELGRELGLSGGLA